MTVPTRLGVEPLAFTVPCRKFQDVTGGFRCCVQEVCCLFCEIILVLFGLCTFCLKLVDFLLLQRLSLSPAFICKECLPFDAMFSEMDDAVECREIVKTVPALFAHLAMFGGVQCFSIGVDVVDCHIFAVVDTGSKMSNTGWSIQVFLAVQGFDGSNSIMSISVGFADDLFRVTLGMCAAMGCHNSFTVF